MGHVDHEVGANFLGDLAEAFEVDLFRECGRAGDDQLRLAFARQALHCLVVDVFFRRQTVGHDVKPFAGHVQRHAVGQVAAFGQRHTHDQVAWFQHGKEHALVRLRAGVRLHVRAFGAEQLFHTVDGQLLGHVDVFAATVVALAWVTFGVLVRQLRALRFHYGWRRVVFRRDQFDVIVLARVLFLNDGEQFRIDVGEGVIFCKHVKTPSMRVLVLADWIE
ncbi:hypothetical protein D3C87_1042980 [compost metagenome]